MIRFTHSWYCASRIYTFSTHVLSLCASLCVYRYALANLWWPIVLLVRRPCTSSKEKLCVASALLHTHVPVWTHTVRFIYIDNSSIPTEFPTYFRLRFQIHLGDYCDCFGKISINRRITVWCIKAILYSVMFSYISEQRLSVQRILCSRLDLMTSSYENCFICFSLVRQSVSIYLSVCDN